MTAADQPAGYRVKGWHVLAGVVGFFSVVVAVDAAFMVQAIRTYPGEVSVTPYEDGLAYNKKIARLEAQAQLGWTAAAEAAPGAVVVTFRDKAGAPVSGLSVTGGLQRPATETGRRALAFREEAAGRYVAPAIGVRGAWDLTAVARAGAGHSFEAERRLTWR